MIPAAFASWVTERLADALGWSYRSSAIVDVAAGAVGCTAFFAAVNLAGESWGLVVALPLLLSIGAFVGPALYHRVVGRSQVNR
jgi:hypothetical protein